MGAYGKVYTTYNLTYGADRSSGFVEGNGQELLTLKPLSLDILLEFGTVKAPLLSCITLCTLAMVLKSFDVIRFDARGRRCNIRCTS